MYANFTFIFSLADIFCASVFLYTLAIHDSVFSVSQSGLIHSKCCFTQKSLRKKNSKTKNYNKKNNTIK